MTLTTEQQEQITALLNNRNIGSKGCHMCGTTGGWELEPVIYEMREFGGNAVATAATVYPALVLTCNSCGHAAFLSALRLKVIVPVEQAENGENTTAGQG